MARFIWEDQLCLFFGLGRSGVGWGGVGWGGVGWGGVGWGGVGVGMCVWGASRDFLNALLIYTHVSKTVAIAESLFFHLRQAICINSSNDNRMQRNEPAKWMMQCSWLLGARDERFLLFTPL